MLDPVYKRAAELEKRLEFLEALCDEHFVNPMVQSYAGSRAQCRFCGAAKASGEHTPHHSAADCPVSKYAEYKRENTQDG
jgi:hypothetical protein